MTGFHLGIPYTRPFYGDTVKSLMLAEVPGRVALDFRPYMSVDVARNTIAREFLKNDQADYLWFVDNDCVFAPGALKRLLGRGVPFVCGTMFTRSLPPTPTIGKYRGMTEEGKHLYQFGPTVRKIRELAEARGLPDDVENDIILDDGGDGDLVEVDGCGMHFCLIRKDVIETVKPPWFVMGGRGGAGEDFYFCHKAQEAGFPIYWDTTVYTGHALVDGKDYGLREMLAWTEYVDREFGVIDDANRWEVDRAE